MAVRNRSITKRYSKALWLLANECDVLEGWLNFLKPFSKSINSNKELSKLVSSPIFSTDQKWSVLKEFLSKNDIDNKLYLFIKKICFTNRLTLLDDIILESQGILDERSGFVPAIIESAKELSSDELILITESIENKVGKKPKVQVVIKESLLCGVKVHVLGKTWDASLATGLDNLKKQLLNESLN